MLRSVARCSIFNAFYSKESLFAAVNICKGEKIIIKRKEENELEILNTYLEDKANILESFSVKVEVLDAEQREINRLADMSLEHAERN